MRTTGVGRRCPVSGRGTPRPAASFPADHLQTQPLQGWPEVCEDAGWWRPGWQRRKWSVRSRVERAAPGAAVTLAAAAGPVPAPLRGPCSAAWEGRRLSGSGRVTAFDRGSTRWGRKTGVCSERVNACAPRSLSFPAAEQPGARRRGLPRIGP